jgi:polysaccharide biosynthesis protein PslH
MKHQATLLEDVESKFAPRFDLNVMTSQVDEKRLRALAPSAAATVIPNGVDVDYFRPRSPESIAPDRLLFLGPTYMFPNRDAVDFFLSQAWSLVRQSCPQTTLHLVGKNSVEEKARFESYPDVVCNGHVPDVRPYLAEAAVSIVPIRVGGGTRLKILDAWSMGKAVVSTSVGCEGLATVDGANILIRDNAEDFAAGVIQLLRDSELRERIGREARKTVERYYAWSVVGARLTGLYEDLIATRSRAN